MTPEFSEEKRPRGARWPRAVARGLARGVALLALLAIGAWGIGALKYQMPFPSSLTALVIVVWGMICAAMGGLLLGRTRHWRPVLALYVAACAIMVIWWSSLQPSNDRAWAADVGRMTYGEVEGAHVSLHNVRDFIWQGEADFMPRWESREYDLDQLRTVDLFLSYWGNEAIAHTLVSFGFADGERVVFSVEIRKEQHERFSELGGFFKQFEMSVIAADERDIVGVRTFERGEDVYLYPIRMKPDAMRRLFVSYVETANALVRKPRFYHTVTANCTTIVYRMVRAIVPDLPMDPRILLSGYLPSYLYKIGAIDNRVPLAQWRQWAAIDERAQLSREQAGDFSTAIRAGQPLP